MKRVVWNATRVVLVPLAIALVSASGVGCKQQPSSPESTQPEPGARQDPMQPAPNEAWGEAQPANGAGGAQGAAALTERPPTAAEELAED